MDLTSRSGEAAVASFSICTERDLHDLWERQRFRREGLLTEDAVPRSVEFPRYRWGEGGPDFRGARLRFAGQRPRGDVELHLSPSGWGAISELCPRSRAGSDGHRSTRFRLLRSPGRVRLFWSVP